MAVTSTRPDGLRTRGAQVLARFIPLHEEHAPLGFGLDVDAAVLQVGSHVGDAARLATDPDSSSVTVAVPLAWAAAMALAAIARLSPTPEQAHARAKDELLVHIDRAAQERLATAQGSSAANLVARVTAALGGAFAGMAEHGAGEPIGDALFEMVVSAVVAVELLEGRDA